MGIFSRFIKDEIIENNEEEPRNTERSSIIVKCSGCGATNLISNDGVCEYCGLPLKYAADDKMVSSASAVGSKINVEQNANAVDTYTLIAGFYTAGIDIPPGKCNITAISGCGNLYSSDGELNESFGTEEDYVPSYKGFKLPKDVALCVYGDLTVRVDYKSVDGGVTGRSYDTAHIIELSDGNYEAGADFEAGTYNIVAVSGAGNIYSDEGDVNEAFGTEDDYVREIKNVHLDEGVELSLEGGLSVKLIPAVPV